MNNNNIKILSDKVYYIYKTTNILNNKIYIGKHKGLLKDDYVGSGKIIKQAIKKYGKNNFKKEVLIICEDNEKANYFEKFFIQLFNSLQPNGYNITTGGDWGDTITYNPNKEKIISNMKAHSARRGKTLKDNFPGHSKAISRRNTLFCKNKTIKQMYGEQKANEMKQKYRKRTGKNNSFYGKKHTFETRQRIKDKLTGRKLSEEICKKISEGHKGLKYNADPTVQRKQKISKIKNIYNNYLKNKKYKSMEEIILEIIYLKKIGIIKRGNSTSYNKELWEEVLGYELL